MKRSYLCGYSDGNIVVKGAVTDERDNDAKQWNKNPTIKNNASFRSCILKLSNTFSHDAEDLDIAMRIYNLLEYRYNYSMKLGSLWSYYRGEVNDDEKEKHNANCTINNSEIKTSKSFEYNTKLKGCAPNNKLDAEVVVLLKYLSDFWRFLNFPLISCKIELNFSWSKECIISEISIIPAVPGNRDTNLPVPDVAAIQATAATFQINNAKLYAPVVTSYTTVARKFTAGI